MSQKVFLLLCLIHFARSDVWLYVGSVSMSARGNNYGEMRYGGPTSFVGAVKLVHTKGSVANSGSVNGGNWGGSSDGQRLLTLITDTDNRIIYPSRHVATVKKPEGWYKIPGYVANSPVLIFSNFCGPEYFVKDRKLRFWYGEDFYGHTESDNSGTTYMDVYFYLLGN